MTANRWRSLVAWMFLVVTLAAELPAGAASEGEMSAAQHQANQAAGDLSRAEAELSRADEKLTQLTTQVGAVEARVGSLRAQVGNLAIRRYVSGTAPLLRLLRLQDANEALRAQQYTTVIAGSSTESLGRYRAERGELDDQVKELRKGQQARNDAVENLRTRRADAAGLVERLSRQDEERKAQLLREEQRRVAAQPAAPANAPAPPTPAAARPPDVSAAARAGAPAPQASPPVTGDGWVCPVAGPHAFSNDYGAPRGGGRSHEGNDILAPRGTPVVANVSGVVEQHDNGLGGHAYFLNGNDGNSYYGAHLDSYGASGQVSAGTVIGTVGDSGDAQGGPTHLHFEIHPGGNGNINPYPTLSRYC